MAGVALLLSGCAAGPTAGSGAHPAQPQQTTGSASAPAGDSVPPASVWPAASGDAGRTSPAVTTGPQTGRRAWQRRLEGAVVPGPVVGADGSVLAASNGGVLHALDPASGADRWTYDGGGSYGSDLSTSPAVLPDGTILWPGPHNRLYGLTATGRLLWTVELDAFVLSPAVVGRRAYVATAAGTLLALDVPDEGQPREAWRLDVGGTSYSSPAVGPDGTVYAAADRTVTAVRDNGDSAHVRWQFRTRDTIEVSTAVGSDGTIVVGTNNDVQYGLRRDGGVRWTFDRGDWTYSSPVVRDGRTWFGSHLGQVDVLDVATGTLLQRDLGLPRAQGTSSVGTGIWTAPLVDTAQNVYVGTAAGHVYGFAPDGHRLWDAPVGGVIASYPALTADGTLVLGSTNGTLYAFRDAPAATAQAAPAPTATTSGS